MFTKSTFALAFVLAAASGALAATKQQSFQPRNDAYDARGNYVGSDPDANVRFELRRDWDHGK
jgi:mannose/cellobiose epimerase-like protein (N-acyl-D-glucosamine 2-epimerase family)